MRIEPTTRSLPRQSSDRRHSVDTLNTVSHHGNGSAPISKQPITDDSSSKEVKSYDIIPHTGSHHNTMRRLSSKRWRSYVPFIAHYIGQETALETPGRLARRHSEFAKKAYQKQLSSAPSPRTLAQV